MIRRFSLNVCIESEDVSQKAQLSSGPKTPCIKDTRVSCLKSVLGGAPLGETPFFTTPLANGSIDESFENVSNLTVDNQIRHFRIHCC